MKASNEEAESPIAPCQGYVAADAWSLIAQSRPILGPREGALNWLYDALCGNIIRELHVLNIMRLTATL